MAEKASMHRAIIMLLLAASLALTACGPKVKKPSSTAGTEVGAGSGTGAQGSGTGPNAGATAAGTGNPDDETAGPQTGLLATRIVYFDFDSSDIKGESTDVVAAHAKYLGTNPSARIRLEGHTDERGSPEYNIGLGERRAQAVRHSMLLQGASDAQITTVSYGEERPAVAGHDDAAWAKNRRVEIVYLTPAAVPK
jgi:peptidoglycan-associated lipoprotein